MAFDTFAWPPSLGVVGTTNYAVDSAQFGDGYAQAAADGINNVADTWPLTFEGDTARISAIKAFLDSKGGWTRFYWTPPLRAQGLFRATAPTVRPNGGGMYTLTATFTEAF